MWNINKETILRQVCFAFKKHFYVGFLPKLFLPSRSIDVPGSTSEGYWVLEEKVNSNR